MREKRDALQFIVAVTAVCFILFSVNHVYGNKAVEMPVRPFALNPENLHLRLDGIFDIRDDNHGIGVYLKNVGDTTIYNVTATASFEADSGIVLKEHFKEFGDLAPGNSLLEVFQASFANSSPGKYPLTLEVSGESFNQTIWRNVFVIHSGTDANDPHKWTVKTPQGTITTKVHELHSSNKLGSSVAVKTYNWVVEYIKRPKGQFSDLPYSDPWWKVIGSIVPVDGTIIDTTTASLYGPGLGDTAKSVARAAFTTSALAVTANETDPFRRGQEETKPGPDEVTIKEEVEVSMTYRSEPEVGKPYTADAQCTYTRTTNLQDYQCKFKHKVRNTHSTGKPKIKIERRESGEGQDFLITAQTRGPKLRNNEAYFVANLFEADDPYLEHVVQPIILQDNGRQGDRKAGDGIYTGKGSADDLTPDTPFNVFVFGFDINNAPKSDPPLTAATKIGGVLISAPSFILFPKKSERVEKNESPKSKIIKPVGVIKKVAGTLEKTSRIIIKTGGVLKKILGIFLFSSISTDGWASYDFVIPGESEDGNSGNGFLARDISGHFSGGVKLSLGHKVFIISHVFGVAVGYRSPRIKFSNGFNEESPDLELSTYAIPMELFYKIPVGKKFFFRFAAGVDLYKSTIDHSIGTFKDSGFGTHLSLGTGYFLTKRLALTFNAEYVSAKLNNFTTIVDGVKKGLFVNDVTLGDFNVNIDAPPPYKLLEVDFSGLQLSIGIKLCIIR